VLKEKYPEGAFHYVGYPVALIVPGPPVVRYLPAYPSKIVYQLLKKFPAHTPILAWFFDTLNSWRKTVLSRFNLLDIFIAGKI
jgi:hypothetical protein